MGEVTERHIEVAVGACAQLTLSVYGDGAWYLRMVERHDGGLSDRPVLSGRGATVGELAAS